MIIISLFSCFLLKQEGHINQLNNLRSYKTKCLNNIQL